MTGPRRPTLHLGWRRGDCLALMALLAIWGVALAVEGGGAARDPSARVQADRTNLIRELIDPNTASSVSLRRLPGIGPARAAGIVKYRQDAAEASPGRPVFRYADDLRKVFDIGPGTVSHLKPFLSLPACPASASSPTR